MSSFYCPMCGGEIKKTNDGYVCSFCNSRFQQTLEDEYLDYIQNKLQQKEIELVNHIKKELYIESQKEYIDDQKIRRLLLDLSNLLDDDFYAEYFRVIILGKPNEIHEYFQKNIEHSETDICFALDMLLKRGSSLGGEILLPINYIQENFLQRQNPTLFGTYNKKLQELSKVIDSGIYDYEKPRDIFIAYASLDYENVYEITEYLESQGLTCFVALRNLAHGSFQDYKFALEKAILNCNHFVFLSSARSRRRDCDAFSFELPYAVSIKKDCLEYIVDPHNPNMATDKIVENYFKNKEWVFSKEDLIKRIKSSENAEENLSQDKYVLRDPDIIGTRLFLDREVKEKDSTIIYYSNNIPPLRDDNMDSLEQDSFVTFGAYPMSLDTPNKREPIVWQVFEDDYETVTLISKYIIDDKQLFTRLDKDYYYGLEKDGYSLHKWLNEEFLPIAFTYNERKCLKDFCLSDVSLTTKVCIPSRKDMEKFSKGQVDRLYCTPTPYAYLRGAYFWHKGGKYVLRDHDGKQAIVVDGFGNYSSGFQEEVNDKYGIRPMIVVDKNLLFKYSKTLAHRSYEKNQFKMLPIYYFGRQNNKEVEWLKLKDEGDKVLLLSKYLLFKSSYNKKEMKVNNYKKASIRSVLKKFAGQIFSKEELKKILLVQLQDTKTKDLLFLPNEEELLALAGNEEWNFARYFVRSYLPHKDCLGDDEKGPCVIVYDGEVSGSSSKTENGERVCIYVSKDTFSSLKTSQI